jgi:hypothetical protein
MAFHRPAAMATAVRLMTDPAPQGKDNAWPHRGADRLQLGSVAVHGARVSGWWANDSRKISPTRVRKWAGVDDTAWATTASGSHAKARAVSVTGP